MTDDNKCIYQKLLAFRSSSDQVRHLLARRDLSRWEHFRIWLALKVLP